MGKEFLGTFVKNTREYQEKTDTATGRKELIDSSFGQWTACLLIKNSNQRSKYILLVSCLLASQF
jgi:hypothetical protein